jgi:hypothetical protein
MSRRRRQLLIGSLVLVAAVAALAVGLALSLRDTAPPASIGAAVARFRAQALQADLPIPPGVYVYTTTGQESVSALGGTRHAYPAESTITVVGGGCGVKLRWDVLETRWNELQLCDGAQRLPVWQEAHQFFGQDDRSTWTCSEATWLPAETKPGSETPYRCESGGTLQEGATVVVGEETLTVAGADVATVHVRLTADESGDARGKLVEDRWLEAGTGLPVRIGGRVRTSNASPIGEVVFQERYTLDLTSFQPRR